MPIEIGQLDTHIDLVPDAGAGPAPTHGRSTDARARRELEERLKRSLREELQSALRELY